MDPREQVEILERGVADLISPEELLAKLERAAQEGRPLRVKYGADPSAPDIHIGHTVCIRKMKQFQDLGHEVYFIIGDFTGRIGDPSGRSETRRQLSEGEVLENAKTYQKQIFKILDPDKTKVVFNSAWHSKLSFADVIQLGAKYTVARMLERDDFKARLAQEKPVGIHELLYPLAQAYDSVAISADVELGGTDQTFNFLLTREIQKEYGQTPQVVLTMPLLEGTDGVNKMSKSLGNYIGIDEPPGEMFGKVMSIPDRLMIKYFELVTEVPMAEVRQIESGLESGTLHPMAAKKRLAREIVRLYHGEEAAARAEREFDRVFSRRELPENLPVVYVDKSALAEPSGKVRAYKLVVALGLSPSSSEANRLIRQGAVKVDGVKVSDPADELELSQGMVVQVGRRRFAAVSLEPGEKAGAGCP